jgi:hypothetical protein
LFRTNCSRHICTNQYKLKFTKKSSLQGEKLWCLIKKNKLVNQKIKAFKPWQKTNWQKTNWQNKLAKSHEITIGKKKQKKTVPTINQNGETASRFPRGSRNLYNYTCVA